MNGDMRFFLTVFLRRLPLFSTVVVVCTALALAVAVLLPPVYRAEALLVVESPQIPGELASTTVQTGAAEQLQIIQQRMLSRSQMLDLAQSLGAYRGQRLDPAQIVNDMRARTQMTILEGRDRATLVRLAFDAAEPQMAADGASALVNFILEENVALRTRAAAQTVDFFQLELQRLGDELDRRSALIARFKLENRDALPENLPAFRARQAELEDRLADLATERRRLAAERTAYVERYERTGRVEVIVEDRYAPFLRRLAALQDELDTVLAGESAQAPRAVGLRGRIAAVERSINAQLAAEGMATGGASAIHERQLSTIDQRDGDLADRMAETEALLSEVNTRIQAALEAQLRLDVLERDYETTQAQYGMALERVAAAETGDLIEVQARGQRITVIEQVVVPEKPASPNRALIAIGGLVGGIAAGVMLLWLLERLNQTIRRPADLGRHLGIAAFATIPYTMNPNETSMRRMGSVALGLAILLGVPLALFLLHVHYLPLDLLLTQIVARLGLLPMIEQMRQGAFL